MIGVGGIISTPITGWGYSDGQQYPATGSADGIVLAGLGVVVSLVKDDTNGTLILDIDSEDNGFIEPELLESITVTNFLGTDEDQAFTFNVEDATTSELGTSIVRFTWETDEPSFQDAPEFQFQSVRAPNGVDIVGVVWFPYLDLGNLGTQKNMIAFDIVADAENGLSVSFGYDQRDNTLRTTDYEMEGDTLPGTQVPMPISGPSFDMKITFAARQLWEFEAACLYVNDNRLGA